MIAHTQNDRLKYLPYAHSVELLTVGTHCHYCLGQKDLAFITSRGSVGTRIDPYSWMPE